MTRKYEIKEYIIYTIKSIFGIEDSKPEKKTAEYHEPCTWCAHCFYDEERYPYWFCKYYGKHERTGKYKPCTSRCCTVIKR